MLHKSCVHRIESGQNIDAANTPPCQFPGIRRDLEENQQIYSIDASIVSSTEIYTAMNASFGVPKNPPHNAGQINYLWPGFKHDQPVMGLPVLQPVLQYGTGDNWVVASWYVFGNQGEAWESTPVPVTPGDNISSYMQYDDKAQQWTIYAKNLRTTKDTTLLVSRARTRNYDFKCALYVLETIMPSNVCSLLPGAPNSITFTGIKLNGNTKISWKPRTQMQDCKQQCQVAANGDITMSWKNQ
jgi:hypothetical protein